MTDLNKMVKMIKTQSQIAYLHNYKSESVITLRELNEIFKECGINVKLEPT